MSEEKRDHLEYWDSVLDRYAEQGDPHLQSMCSPMKRFLREGRIGKFFRWLGFVQGVLWERGIYTIDDFEEHNRNRCAVLEDSTPASGEGDTERPSPVVASARDDPGACVCGNCGAYNIHEPSVPASGEQSVSDEWVREAKARIQHLEREADLWKTRYAARALKHEGDTSTSREKARETLRGTASMMEDPPTEDEIEALLDRAEASGEGEDTDPDGALAEFRDDFPHVVDAYEKLCGVTVMLREGRYDDVKTSLVPRIYEIRKRLWGLMASLRHEYESRPRPTGEPEPVAYVIERKRPFSISDEGEVGSSAGWVPESLQFEKPGWSGVLDSRQDKLRWRPLHTHPPTEGDENE